MAKKQRCAGIPTWRETVVRVVTSMPEDRSALEPVIPDEFLESLRYAGLIDLHETDPNGNTMQCFDIVCPIRGGDTKKWAEMTAKRMRTFGFNAVPAPRT